jgi:hypothetical protein
MQELHEEYMSESGSRNVLLQSIENKFVFSHKKDTRASGDEKVAICSCILLTITLLFFRTRKTRRANGDEKREFEMVSYHTVRE